MIPLSIDSKAMNLKNVTWNAYTSQQDEKRKVLGLNLNDWKKETTLTVGDLVLAILREGKLFRN